LNEHKGSIVGNLYEDFLQVAQATKSEILEVSGKFYPQLTNFIESEFDIEKNEPAQDRIKKASIYFEGKIKSGIHEALQNTTITTDNKSVRKSLNDVLQRLRDEVHVKTACLSSSSTGFTIKDYTSAKAKATISKPELPSKQNKLSKSESKRTQHTPDEGTPSIVKDQALYDLLKEWRDSMAKDLNLPHYMIIPIKTMTDLAALRPTSLLNLKKVKGIGKKTAEKYGEDILGIINKYCMENKLEEAK
jgi:superfamily II DNA helicase RecQ